MEIPSILTFDHERLGVLNFFRRLARTFWMDFRSERYYKKRESFELSAHGLKAERCGFLVENRSKAGAVQKIDSILVLLLRGTVNRELKIAQNTTSETKGRLFTVDKVSKQNVYLTLIHAHI